MKTDKFAEIFGAQHQLIEHLKNNNLLETSFYEDVVHHRKGWTFQPLPLLLEQATANELGERTQQLFRLIKSIPERIFELKEEEIAAYYKIPAGLVAQQLKHYSPESLKNLIGRADINLTDRGFKCVEFNISANLGNMIEVHLLRDKYLGNKYLNPYLVNLNREFSPNLMDDYFEFIVGRCKDISNDDSYHVVFASPNPVPGFFLESLNELSSRFENEKSLTFGICSYFDLRINQNKLWHNGKRIHCLIERYDGRVPEQISALGLSKQLILLGGGLTTLLQNKTNFALLSELGNSHLFNDEEKALINEFVPWTRKMDKTRFYEDSYFRQFVIDEKDSLILKQSNLSSGESVTIGKETPQHVWNDTVQQSINSNNWLVQECVESIPYEFLNENNELAHHLARWGVYIFGDKISLKELMVKPVSARHSVVNGHCGGKFTCVFEFAS